MPCYSKIFNTPVFTPVSGYVYSHKWEVFKSIGGAPIHVISGAGLPLNEMYTFTENGGYKVCLTIYAETADINIECYKTFCKEIKIDCVEPCKVEEFDFSIVDTETNCRTKNLIPSTITPGPGYTYQHIWQIFEGGSKIHETAPISGVPTNYTFVFPQNGYYIVK